MSFLLTIASFSGNDPYFFLVRESTQRRRPQKPYYSSDFDPTLELPEPPSYRNDAVLDMLNTRYLIVPGDNGQPQAVRRATSIINFSFF